jgi:hypothetical protein
LVTDVITIGKAMDRLKLRYATQNLSRIAGASLRDSASYRARRRNAARTVRRHLDGRRPRLEDLPYTPPPKVPPRTYRKRISAGIPVEAAVDTLVQKMLRRR